MEEERQIISDLKKRIYQLEALLQVYNPAKYPANVLSTHQADWTRKVEAAFTDVTEASFSVKELMLDNQEDYDGLVRGITGKVSAFLLDISVKALSLNPAMMDSNHGNSLSSVSATGVPNYEARNAAATIEVDVEELQVAVNSLLKEIRMTEDVGAAGDHEVIVMMQSVTPWRKRFRDIQSKYFDIKKKVNQFKLDEQIIVDTQTAVCDLETELEEKIADLEYEDGQRKLFSLSKEKSSNIKYPSFHGHDYEDYTRFEHEIKSAFESNKVAKKDRVKVLRDCLDGDALILVPRDLKSIEKAFANLSTRFSDATRLMRHKMETLSGLGMFPKPGSKAPSHLRAQLKWLVQVDQLLTDMFDLALKNSDLHCEVYKPSTLRAFKKLFPYAMCEAMGERCVGVAEDTPSKMSSLQTFVQEKKNLVQSLLSDADITIAGSASLAHTYEDKIGIGDEECEMDSDDEFFAKMTTILY